MALQATSTMAVTGKIAVQALVAISSTSTTSASGKLLAGGTVSMTAISTLLTVALVTKRLMLTETFVVGLSASAIYGASPGTARAVRPGYTPVSGAGSGVTSPSVPDSAKGVRPYYSTVSTAASR